MVEIADAEVATMKTIESRIQADADADVHRQLVVIEVPAVSRRRPTEAPENIEHPGDGPIAQLMREPLVVPDFKPFLRDEAHER
jgi:hypothetical protein